MRAIIAAIKYFYREPEDVLCGLFATLLVLCGISAITLWIWAMSKLLIYMIFE